MSMVIPVTVTAEDIETVEAAQRAAFEIARQNGIPASTFADLGRISVPVLRHLSEDVAQPLGVRVYAAAALRAAPRIRETPGYICKMCATPSPSGIGYVSQAPDAVAMSPTIQSCECGYSRVEAQSGEVTP